MITNVTKLVAVCRVLGLDIHTRDNGWLVVWCANATVAKGLVGMITKDLMPMVDPIKDTCVRMPLTNDARYELEKALGAK
jgi:hypothetical protein